MEDVVEIAKQAARVGGEILKKWFGRSLKVEEKGRSDFVTEVDRESEKMIKEFLRRELPEASFLGEELGYEGSSSLRWLIDPLDGTKNYINAVPFFCVSVALQEGKEVVAGVVFNPITEEMYWASRKHGAYKNGQKINTSDKSDITKSLIATGLPFKHVAIIETYLESFKEVFLRVGGIRHMGSAALDLCLTAEGKFDGFWEWGLSPWDVAAGGLCIIEAGGIMSDIWGGPEWLETGCVIGANPHIFHELSKLITNVFKKLRKVS